MSALNKAALLAAASLKRQPVELPGGGSIIVRELTPRRILEEHLRKLPVRLRPRPAPRLP